MKTTLQLVIPYLLDQEDAMKQTIPLMMDEEYLTDIQLEHFLYYVGDLHIEGDLNLDYLKQNWNVKDEDWLKPLTIQRGMIIKSFNTVKHKFKKYESPLKLAGIHLNDTLIEINGNPIESPASLREIASHITGTYTVRYMHLNEIHETTVDIPLDKNGKPIITLGFRGDQITQIDISDIRGLYVDGNLTVNGHIINSDLSSGATLFVSKDIHADNIITGGSDIFVGGNLMIKHLLYGMYNDGFLYVNQEIHSEVYINDDHDIQGTIQEGTLIVSNRNECNITYTPKQYLLEEYAYDAMKLLEAIEKKQPYMHENLKK